MLITQRVESAFRMKIALASCSLTFKGVFMILVVRTIKWKANPTFCCSQHLVKSVSSIRLLPAERVAALATIDNILSISLRQIQHILLMLLNFLRCLFSFVNYLINGHII